MCRVTGLIAVLIVGLSVTALAQRPEEKLPIPSDAAQKQAASLIANLFKADYNAAKTPAQRSELAKKMLQVGVESKDDPTGRYVLLRISRDIAADAGDVQTTLKSIEQITNTYDVDGLGMQAEAFGKIVKALRLPKDHQELGPRLQHSIHDAIAQDRFDLAKSIAETALDSARQARSAELVKQVVAQIKDVASLEAEFKNVLVAFEKLKMSPTDPDANLLVGRYQCFIKGDWENGLLMLALGSDESLRKLAEAELVEKPDAFTVGNAWWDYAERADGSSQASLQERARYWYKQAQPGLDGLSKKLVDSRLKEATPSVEKPKIIQSRTAEWKGSSSDYARYANLVFEVGMGNRNRNGFGQAGIEVEGVSELTVAVEGSAQFTHFDSNDFAGFLVDYHTPDGYTRRVALSFGFHNKARANAGPSWGAGGEKFAELHDLGRKPQYTLNLKQWAPSNWDGKAWFTVMLQNSGTNTFLRAGIISPQKWDVQEDALSGNRLGR